MAGSHKPNIQPTNKPSFKNTSADALTIKMQEIPLHVGLCKKVSCNLITTELSFHLLSRFANQFFNTMYLIEDVKITSPIQIKDSNKFN